MAAASPRIRRPGRSRMACGKSWCWAPVSTPSLTGLEPTGVARRFELNHPATQETPARRGANRRAGTCRLCRSRFRAWEHDRRRSAAQARPDDATFVIWLGVTPYLTAEAVYATLGELARWPGQGRKSCSTTPTRPNSGVGTRPRGIHHDQMAGARRGERGGPFRCYFDTAALHMAARRPRMRGSKTSIERSWFSAIFPTCLSPPAGARRPRQSGCRAASQIPI